MCLLLAGIGLGTQIDLTNDDLQSLKKQDSSVTVLSNKVTDTDVIKQFEKLADEHQTLLAKHKQLKLQLNTTIADLQTLKQQQLIDDDLEKRFIEELKRRKIPTKASFDQLREDYSKVLQQNRQLKSEIAELSPNRISDTDLHGILPEKYDGMLTRMDQQQKQDLLDFNNQPEDEYWGAETKLKLLDFINLHPQGSQVDVSQLECKQDQCILLLEDKESSKMLRENMREQGFSSEEIAESLDKRQSVNQFIVQDMKKIESQTQLGVGIAQQRWTRDYTFLRLEKLRPRT